ncbi:TPA: hypothetical protein DF272_06155 [Candidatus Falkowbacteria bacterium]|nr:hypothetical protein [Candidatus Falkowbacteria bacterium]
MVLNFRLFENSTDMVVSAASLQLETNFGVKLIKVPGLVQVINTLFREVVRVKTDRGELLTGVDIGWDNVAWMRLLDTNDKGFEVLLEGIQATPKYDESNLLFLKDLGAMAELVRALHSLCHSIVGFSSNRVAFALPDCAVMTKYFSFDAAESDNLEVLVKRRFEETFPFAPEHFIWGWRESARVDGCIFVMASAVKKDLYNGYLAVLTQAGLDPVVMTTRAEVYSLTHSIQESARRGENAVVIDLGRADFSVYSYQSGRLCFDRYVAPSETGEVSLGQLWRTINYERLVALHRIDRFFITGIGADDPELAEKFHHTACEVSARHDHLPGLSLDEDEPSTVTITNSVAPKTEPERIVFEKLEVFDPTLEVFDPTLNSAIRFEPEMSLAAALASIKG